MHLKYYNINFLMSLQNTRSGRLDFIATSQLWKGMKAYRVSFTKNKRSIKNIYTKKCANALEHTQHI